MSKLKTSTRNNKGTTLRISNKNFNKQELQHDLFLTQKQVTKLRNSINSNMSTDIKRRRAQVKKMAQSGGFLGRFLVRFLPKIKPAISIGKTY